MTIKEYCFHQPFLNGRKETEAKFKLNELVAVTVVYRSDLKQNSFIKTGGFIFLFKLFFLFDTFIFADNT